MADLRSVTDANYDDAVATGVVLVDFWAPWCAPCRAMTPILEDIQAANAGNLTVVSMNTDENPATAAGMGVRSLPTLYLYKNGCPIDMRSGAMSKAQILSWLKPHL
jgi:thioredoxin 1